MTPINPEWETWIIKAINSQLEMRLKDQNLIFANHQAPEFLKLEKWVEVSFFGPLYDYDNREVTATIQVQLRAFLKTEGNIYSMNTITGLIAQAVTTPIRVPELGKCLTNLGVRILPKGRILSPHSAVAAEVTVTYTIQPQE